MTERFLTPTNSAEHNRAARFALGADIDTTIDAAIAKQGDAANELNRERLAALRQGTAVGEWRVMVTGGDLSKALGLTLVRHGNGIMEYRVSALSLQPDGEWDVTEKFCFDSEGHLDTLHIQKNEKGRLVETIGADDQVAVFAERLADVRGGERGMVATNRSSIGAIAIATAEG